MEKEVGYFWFNLGKWLAVEIHFDFCEKLFISGELISAHQSRELHHIYLSVTNLKRSLVVVRNRLFQVI